ncbi:16S rRNA-processing protein RimM [Pontibacillus halophilus JSM 076056 = DSM 19796]|uniref:Ribosome maturation factor RimM n=1 Tax=Pontibacillus halophilus JSM 076056 = DSM 19796 TaxID=1385510 RepID=A0A0A5GMI1_9BACI|nr:ribosome maturation factor RimM [Pontibacillus halophilus]KGX93189.1 16S rRNA-processing protein RimM [Pontibacillus halophilus JSM 076056 = DSM 19796]
MESSLYTIGKVVNTHGVRGEVRVIQVTDFEDRFEPGNVVYFISPDGGKPQTLTIRTHRTHKNFQLVSFEDYPSLNDVEPMKGGELAISEEQQGELSEGEFYYHEIIGCEVHTTSGEHIGQIKEILSPGANDVWVIKRKGKKDALIPYIEQVVKQINVDEKKVTIEPMEGLLD